MFIRNETSSKFREYAVSILNIPLYYRAYPLIETQMQTTTLVDGLCFGEGPRWHDGRLWFSDMHGQTVYALSQKGDLEPIVKVANRPSGLGWLPDGRLLIVSMLDKKLLSLDNGQLSEYADLSAHASFTCNDMVVDAAGRSYVGNFGFDMEAGASKSPAELVLIQPDRSVSIAADELSFPNGTIITPDGKTLIVAETMDSRLTAFDISDDGTLNNRRLWAKLEGAIPDGMCLDQQSAIWVASPNSHEVLRVLEGGEVTDRITIENQAYACMLGGEARKRLYIMTCVSSSPEKCVKYKTGRVEFVDVDVPGAGLP